MSRMFAGFCVLTCWCLLAAQAAAAQEQREPPPPPNNCTLVNVDITSPDGPVTVNNNNVTCKHGYLQSITPSNSNASTIVLTQSLSYGPDCTITFTVGSCTAQIQVQQNYCALEAGSLTASVISGTASITSTQPGSYEGNEPGVVDVTVCN